MVDKLRVEWWHSATLPVNWKLAMEAFIEGLHVMRTHPQLQQANCCRGTTAISAPPGPGKHGRAGAVQCSRSWVEMSINYNTILSEGMAGNGACQ